jgi:hypothetical protein
VLPLLQDFIKLENAEMTRRAYEAIKDIWPENGLSSDEGLKNVMAQKMCPGRHKTILNTRSKCNKLHSQRR